MNITLEINGYQKASLEKYGALFKKAAGFLSRELKPQHQELKVSVALVEDSVMKSFNRRWRGKNTTTDVLSFAEVNEIVISPAQAFKQAKAAGHSLEQELVFLLVHGLLHLLGYEDETMAGWRKMLELGEKATDWVFKA